MHGASRYLAAVGCSLLLLTLVAASPALAVTPPPPSTGGWVKVFEWTGGGTSNDIRNSAQFTLLGGQQCLSASVQAAGGSLNYPSASWYVYSAATNLWSVMFKPPSVGLSSSYMYLPGGTWYLSSNTLACTWSIVVYELAPPPVVAGFAPTSGPVGTSVTINGSNFIQVTKVTFGGGVEASFKVVSPSQITATVPAGAASGPITVTALGGANANVAAFHVIVPPTIRSFSPTSGPVGTNVTLVGAGFGDVNKVTFGDAQAPFTVVSEVMITATVPDGAATGPITVTSPGGTWVSDAKFAVLIAPEVTLGLGGLTGRVLKLGASATAAGAVTPVSLAGIKVRLDTQMRVGSRWVYVKSASVQTDSTGTYFWKYKPAKRGSYRMKAGLAKTESSLAAGTQWVAFRVK